MFILLTYILTYQLYVMLPAVGMYNLKQFRCITIIRLKLVIKQLVYNNYNYQ